MGMILGSGLFASKPADAAQAFYVMGYHGGFFLTDQRDLSAAVGALAEQASEFPDVVYSMDLEPYTLDRLAHGARLGVEELAVPDAWSLQVAGKGLAQRSQQAARSGKWGLRLRLDSGDWANGCQEISAGSFQGRDVLFRAWVRCRRGRAGLYVEAHGFDGLPAGSNQEAIASPDGVWHQVEIPYTVPSGATALYPQMKVWGAEGGSEADFDDAELILQGCQLFANEGFEQGVSFHNDRAVAALRNLAANGRMTIISSYTQPILFALDGESVVRQIGVARKVVQDALGIPLDSYGTQEPCWCGQMPAALSGFGMKGCLYANCWRLFGTCPAKGAEKLYWCGPDGSEIPAAPLAPPALEGELFSSLPRAHRVRQMRAAGIEHPLFESHDDFRSSFLQQRWDAILRANKYLFYIGIWSNAAFEVPVERIRGKEVELSCRMRTADASRACLYIDSQRFGSIISSERSPFIPSDGQWHNLQIRYPVPSEADAVCPQVRLFDCWGTVDFDQVHLTTLADGREIISLSFEGGEFPDQIKVNTNVEEPQVCAGRVVAGSSADGKPFAQLRVDIEPTDVTFVTIPEYLSLAQDGRRWDDAFAAFQSKICWGLWGGEIYLDAQIAADRTILAERLSVLLGLDGEEELDRMWELTMLAQHHDGWVCAPMIFGQWAGTYPSYGAFIRACREEVEEKLNRLIGMAGNAPGSSFGIVNPTQRRRREWCPVALTIPERTCYKSCEIAGADGESIPSRLVIASRHPDGSVCQVTGYLQAEVDGFAFAAYDVREGTEPSVGCPLPVEVNKLSEGNYEITSGRLSIVLAKDKVSLQQDGRLVLSDIFLEAHIDGQYCRSQVNSVGAVVTEEGIAQGEFRGEIGSVPYAIALQLKPWSETLDIRVSCQFNGERIEGELFHDMGGTLRLVLAYPRAARHLAHQPFELRQPQQTDFWAVRFSLTEWEDEGGGFSAILDRPTGIAYAERHVRIVLCHSGSYPYGQDGKDLVFGEKVYRVSVRPFSTAEQDEAVWQYQTHAYPLTLIPRSTGWPATSFVQVEGHSLVSAMYRQDGQVYLRLWNPLVAETVRVSAPGAVITACNLEGKEPRELGTGEAEVPLRSMQVQTLRLEPATSSVPEIE